MTNPEAFNQLDQFGHDIAKWILDLRSPAKQSFLSHGLPDAKNEDWRYTSLKTMASIPYNWSHARGMIHGHEVKKHLLDSAIKVVFVDGVLDTSFSFGENTQSTGVNIKPLNQAALENTKSIQELFALHHKWNAYDLSTLAEAFTWSGVYIDVAEGFKLDVPIQIMFINTNKPKPFCLFPRVLVRVGKDAECELITGFVGHENGTYLNITNIDINLESGATLSHWSWQNESSLAYHFLSHTVSLESDSQFRSQLLSQGSQLSRSQYHINLAGSNSVADISGVYLVDGNRQSDIYANVHHSAASCHSSQIFKGILRDQSRGVFLGSINVAKGATQTTAYQLNKSLLLSDDAEVKTQPRLRIQNDDVKCSHGATVGQLDPESLFYLRSRGISSTDAEAMLAQGFAVDLLTRGSQITTAGTAKFRASLHQKLEGWF